MPDSSRYILFITIVAAIGGLLFGFDTAIIAGAIGFLKDRFALTALQEGLAVGSLLVGCIAGASIAGSVSDWLGRKRFLLIAASLFIVSGIGAALAHNIGEFVFARFLGGIGVGSASMLSPLYIAEVSPAAIRGRLVSLNQLTIVSGMLLAYFVNWALAGIETRQLALDAGLGNTPGPDLFFAVAPGSGEPALAGQAAAERTGVADSDPHQRPRQGGKGNPPDPGNDGPGDGFAGSSSSSRGCGGRCCWAWCWPFSSRSPASTPCSTTPRAFSSAPGCSGCRPSASRRWSAWSIC